MPIPDPAAIAWSLTRALFTPNEPRMPDLTPTSVNHLDEDKPTWISCMHFLQSMYPSHCQSRGTAGANTPLVDRKETLMRREKENPHTRTFRQSRACYPPDLMLVESKRMTTLDTMSGNQVLVTDVSTPTSKRSASQTMNCNAHIQYMWVELCLQTIILSYLPLLQCLYMRRPF